MGYGAFQIAATSILPLAAGPLLGMVGVEETGERLRQLDDNS